MRDRRRWGLCRIDGAVDPVIGEQAQDRALQPEVVHGHTEDPAPIHGRRSDGVRSVRFRRRDGLRQIRTGHPGRRSGPLDERPGVEIVGRDRGTHRAVLPDPPRQLAGIDPFDPGDPGRFERLAQRTACAPRARTPSGLVHGEARHLDAPALRVLVVDAVVPLMRRRHRHDLSRIGGVGQDLLITGHPRVEDRFPEGLSRRAEPGAAEGRAVLEREQRRATHRHLVGFPSATTSAPRSTVWVTRPRSCRPRNALLRPFDTNGASTTHPWFGSNTTRFAGRPTSIGPP